MLFSVKLFSVRSLIFILFIGLGTVSCQKKYQFSIQAPDKLKVNQTLSIDVTDKYNHTYDSVVYYLDSKRVGQVPLDISNEKLGRRIIKADVYYDGQHKTLVKPVLFFAARPPKVYDYKVINVFPHDTGAYTQGLEYRNGYLYESTGQRGESSLRKVNLKTGKVLQQVDLSPQYFAEGMTIFGDKVYQLTWQSGKGFVYQLNDFKQLKTFDYKKSKEGWGLTHDDKHLIKTDGTARVWFLDPETGQESHFIEAYTDKQSVTNLNELEYIQGKVYANVYQKNIILILNHDNGAIEGVVDLNPLEKEVKKSQNLVPQDEVLNGIAYDKINNRIFVTGKRWGKLFEIEIFERQ
ncbi:MAG: glutamine cyclotransferase [Flavobacteriia bacterium]|nr:MAG: glutamine cyclotransferase [Flavobacteriia bacterium]